MMKCNLEKLYTIAFNACLLTIVYIRTIKEIDIDWYLSFAAILWILITIRIYALSRDKDNAKDNFLSHIKILFNDLFMNYFTILITLVILLIFNQFYSFVPINFTDDFATVTVTLSGVLILSTIIIVLIDLVTVPLSNQIKKRRGKGIKPDVR